jgi:S-adenosylmethionine/arginine decarboxylase-like enzyme
MMGYEQMEEYIVMKEADKSEYEKEKFDDGVFEYYYDRDLWGMVVHIDLFGCNDNIKGIIDLKEWVKGLIEKIDMNAVGFPIIEYLTPTKELAGFSLMQLIETSSITGHFCDATHSAYIDIFSCKPFGPYAATEFCQEFFEAKRADMQVTFRHKGE